MIQFEPDGTILTANQNFLDAMGYSLEEIRGRKHAMFLAPGEAESKAYAQFWDALRSGEEQTGEFARRAKGGRKVYIEASYNPIRDAQGKVVKVVKFAIDVTERQLKAADAAGKIDAIDKNQAMIEFHTDGTIITANDNFLKTMGYALDEVRGQHHRMFMDRREFDEADYARFWADLASGKSKSEVFRRLSKSNQVVHIRAVYAPIFDPSGDIIKIVKFATDITRTQERVIDYNGKVEAISRSQAIIEFDPEGNILTANENFLATTGYAMDEIAGGHHRMFMDPAEARSPEYTEFWHALGRGEFRGGEYRRIGKAGNEIWIQATYNPIFDQGRIVKVVKFATDITERYQATAGLARGLRALANSEAHVRMGPEVGGEFAELRDAFNLAMDQREELIDALAENSRQMLGEAEQLSTIIGDLSARAEKQAATLEETAAAMEEISATVDEVDPVLRDLRVELALAEGARREDRGEPRPAAAATAAWPRNWRRVVWDRAEVGMGSVSQGKGGRGVRRT